MKRKQQPCRVKKARAGKRKCKRCKVVWDRPKGVTELLCPRCQTHCRRCDTALTEDNKVVAKQGRPPQYLCKPCVNELSRKRYNGEQINKSRDYYLTKTFGITSPEYETILKAQGGVCWICQQPRKEGGNRLAVDHLHSKGEKKRNPREKRGRVRGLLCWHCNSALGKFSDSVTKLRRAADYLEAWSAQKILKKEETDG